MIWVVSALVVIAIGVVARAALRQQLNLDALPNAVGSTPATGLPEHPQPSDLDTIRFATALRGYDPLAVDRHLDAVRDAWAAGEDRPATPALEVVLRGYRMDQVDEVLAAVSTQDAAAPAANQAPAVSSGALVAADPTGPTNPTDPADPADPADAGAPTGARPERPAYRPPAPWRRPDLLVVIGYGLAAFWLLSRLFGDLRGGYLSQGVQDQQAFEWYFGAAAHALATASNPLISDLQNFPAGVNLLANASVLGLSVPLAPLTLLAGPHLTFALVEWLGFAATASCWYALFVRRLHVHRAAAVVGGALVGFSPAMVSHGNGHPNFLAQFLVPVIIDRLLDLQRPGRSRRATIRAGIVLGLLVTWQLWMGEEVLLLAAVGIAIVGIVGTLHGRLDVVRMLPGVLVGVATTVVLFGFPLWWQFAGPQSYTSMWNPIANNDLAALWGRATRTWGSDPWASAGLSMNRTEENAFFGIPLWLFAIGATAVLWRSVVVRAAALLVLVTSWLSLGSEITLDHHSVPLPPLWPLVSRLPLFDSLLATRFTLIAVPGFAVLLVVALDRALTPRRAYAVAGRSLHPQLHLVVTVTAVAVALAPVVPTRLWVDQRPPVPVFFTSGSWEKYVDDGSVLAVPPPDIIDMRAVDWQATAGWRFPLVEGYFLGPDGSGSGTGMRGAPRRGFSQWLAEIVQNGVARQATSEQVSHFRDDLAVWQVDVVVLPPRDDRAILQPSVASVLGEPTAVDDVLLWDVRGLR